MTESKSAVQREFRSRQTVRFGDVDPAGVVYYPRIFHFCHIAMEEYFAAVVGIDYPEVVSRYRFGLPVVRTECDFERPLRYGDEIEIVVTVVRVGKSSVEWLFEISSGGGSVSVARATAITVGVDMDRFEKREIPSAVAAGLL